MFNNDVLNLYPKTNVLRRSQLEGRSLEWRMYNNFLDDHNT